MTDLVADLTPEARKIIGLNPNRLCLGDFDPLQVAMAKKAVSLPYCYIAAHMGWGKTAVALFAAREWVRLGIAGKVLILAPLAVARDTWPDEFGLWDFADDLTYSVAVGTAAQRDMALRREADVYIVNYEVLPWLFDRYPPAKWPFDALIYDEASRLKRGAMQTPVKKLPDGRARGGTATPFAKLARVRPHFKRVILMSGTPTPYGLEDLWGQVFQMDLGRRLYPRRKVFLDRWFAYDAYKRKYNPFPHSHAEVMGRISDIFFSVTEEESGQRLRPPRVVDRLVHLSAKEMAVYRRLVKDRVLPEYDVEAPNSAVLTSKLLQIANGAVYPIAEEDEEDENAKPKRPPAVRFHNRKIEALRQIVDEAPDENILVFYQFKFDIDVLREAFPKARVFGDTDHDVEDWNAGKIKMLIAHAASAGHGLNLQHGGRIMVWFGLTWSLGLYQQAMKRLHRRGQKRQVLIYRLLAKGTVDERVAPTLKMRAVQQDAVFDATRAVLDEEASHG